MNQKPNDIDFEVLFPIIPDYVWACREGLEMRAEIDRMIIAKYRSYLPEKPTLKSYNIEGINRNLYSFEVTDVA